MAVNIKRGSTDAIKEIVKLRKGISVKEMVELEKMANTAGGKLVGIEAEDDDWCGTGRFVFPIPIPKPKEFAKVLDEMAAMRVNFESFIYCIPHPEYIQMVVRRQTVDSQMRY